MGKVSDHLSSTISRRRPPPGRIRWHREDGAAAVEFALVLPVLVLLVFGIIQFSIAYNRVQGLHAAAREGARVAALPQTTQDEIVSRVRGALDGVLPDPTVASISVSPEANQPCDLNQGEPVTVTVSFDHDLEIPLWGAQTVTLTGKGEFRCE